MQLQNWTHLEEGNKVVDWLANLGVDQDMQMATFMLPPEEVAELFTEEVVGVAFQRH